MAKFSLLATVVLGLCACELRFDWPWLKKTPSGKQRHEVITAGAFQTIVLQGHGEVVLDPEVPPDQVWVTTDENMIGQVQVNNASGRLTLDQKGGFDFGKNGIEFRISCEVPLREIRLEGMGNIRSKKRISVDGLVIRLNGMGKIDLEVQTPKIEIRQDGTGELRLKGNAEAQMIYSSGLGNINADKLLGQNVEVHSTGLGEIRVNSSESLQVWADGLGKIYYSGKPVHTEIHAQSSVKVQEAEQ